MDSIYFDRIAELRKEKALIERKLNVKISIVGKKVDIEGDALDEFEAEQVLSALSFGFSAKKALTLLEPDMMLRKIHIRSFTRRKDLSEVRSRIIGKEGKTKRTIEEISGCTIIVRESEVGILGSAEAMDYATTAITNVIKGSKQSNVYNYLERMNAEKRKLLDEGLGLKIKEKSE